MLHEITLKTALSWISIVLGLTSAALWWHSASIEVPTELGSGEGGVVFGLKEMSEGFKISAHWNKRAAFVTGATVFLQAVALLLPW